MKECVSTLKNPIFDLVSAMLVLKSWELTFDEKLINTSAFNGEIKKMYRYGTHYRPSIIITEYKRGRRGFFE